MGFHFPKIFLRLAGAGSFVGGVVLLKEFLGGSNYMGNEKLEGKTAIITGSNSGIGKETALEFARRGARVIMACRNIEKCLDARRDIILETRNKKVICKQCDLASFESIRKFANFINESEENLDLLINNAGVMRCPKSYTENDIELQFGTNHLGHFLLTNLLLDLVKKSSPSRIVNVSSVAHMRGQMNFQDLNSDQNYDEAMAYNQSKLANILFTKELSNRLEGSNVTCNAVHPGLVNTNIGRHLSIYKSWVFGLISRPIMWIFLKTSRQGAQTVIYTALNSDLENVSGKYFSNQTEAEPSSSSQDDISAKRLWAISERWTQL